MPNRSSYRIDIVGKKYGALTVLSQNGRAKNGNALWLCLCDCGETTTKHGTDLRGGRYLSCGCLGREKTRLASVKHGEADTETYKIWSGMVNRCNNPNNRSYKNYGGRGINVCEEWLSYSRFKQDMGTRPPGMSIDRIDNNGNYEASNCKWATPKQQANNSRNNILLTVGKTVLTPPQWSESTGVSADIIRSRFKRGWAANDAVYVLPNQGKYKSKKYHILGETLTTAQISKKYSINYHTLVGRIERGWEIHAAALAKTRRSKDVPDMV